MLFSTYNTNEMLFPAYYNANQEFKNGLKDLGIEEDDLDKAYKAMKHVSGGRQLTEDNKVTLKNTDQWTGLIEKISYYIVIALKALNIVNSDKLTQKESRENFNGVISSFTKKIENKRNQEITSQIQV
jgi:hypothetical protein